MYKVYRRDMTVDAVTPVLFYKHLANRPYSFLLESVVGGERLGRYSFIGLEPERVVRIEGRRVSVLNPKSKPVFENIDDKGLATLRNFHNHIFEGLEADPDYPLTSGLVGYIGYDVVRLFERLPEPPADDLRLPDGLLVFPRILVAFDHILQRLSLFVHYRPGRQAEARRDADALVAKIRAARSKFEMFPDAAGVAGNGRVSSNVPASKFMRMVTRAKSHIRRGDIFQVVLSQRFRADFKGDAFWLYRALRTQNPSPYMFYLKYPEFSLIGSSPEILVQLKAGKVNLRPIAGTRPRGRTPVEDRALERQLLADPKERAEHLMLVDLGRNDVGAVARFGTVRTTEAFTIERYSAVMHLVSRVEGMLRPGKDAFDVFAAAFPAGTVTGAPKIRAMEIINDLEPAKRGPYAGAVGYFGAGDQMDFCITIRTILAQKNAAYVQSGAGIVHDSKPRREYIETQNKAKAMLRAVAMARRMSHPS
ncbi:anthranilate synthase component I [bacterium]|nr:anthranilate synthase component I [bacterium]